MKNVQWGGGILDRKNPKGLQRYTKNKKLKIIFIGSIIGIILIIGGISLYRTFALYKIEQSFDVLKGIVPDFRNNKSDVNLIALKVNGKSTKDVPPKDDYWKVEVECDNNATGEWDESKWGLIVTNVTKIPTSCSIDFIVREGASWLLDYKAEIQSFVVPGSGKYKIELWGAQGGRAICDGSWCNTGGKGAYTKGEITIEENTTLYFAIGGAGSNAVNGGKAAGGYNGGGLGTSDNGGGSKDEASGAGGGATDVRLVNSNGDWKNFDSLKSRIMVAAGGGGASYNYAVGAAGGLVAPTVWSGVTPASQTSGYAFGYGQDGNGVAASDGVGGGGSGYYGGGTQNVGYQSSGTGGSSFISGHTGCNAISADSTATNITHTNKPNHYSGYVFTNTQMIDGAGYNWTDQKGAYTGMPTHDGTNGTMVGNTGNGYARITYLGKK